MYTGHDPIVIPYPQSKAQHTNKYYFRVTATSIVHALPAARGPRTSLRSEGARARGGGRSQAKTKTSTKIRSSQFARVQTLKDDPKNNSVLIY